MKFLLLLMSAVCCLAQSTLPSNWAGIGALYNPGGGKATGWASYAKLVDPKSGTYFFTTEDVMPVKGPPFQLQTSVRVGVATIMKDLGPVKILGIVDGGGATVGGSSSGAASGGGIAVWQFNSGWNLMLGLRVLKTAFVSGTPKLYEIGFGRTW